MVYNSFCYCCAEHDSATQELYYCLECLHRLQSAFNSQDSAILTHPYDYDHCVSCGGWENRRIIYTGNTRLFNHIGVGMPICEECVESEMEEIKKL